MDGTGTWSRRRLGALLAAVLAAALTLLFGLGFAIHAGIQQARPANPAAASPAPETTASTSDAARAAILDRPMLQASPADAQSGTPALDPAPAITVPNSTRTGPARVVTGFPHTPQGAVGQLAAIEQTVLSQMDIARSREVHQAWTAPGAVAFEAWPLAGHVQSFLGSAGMGTSLEAGARVTVVPAGAQVKGVDGDDWVVACVLLDVRALVRVEARMAYGYCEAMTWADGRWLVASPHPAVTAPSTWPGTDLAARAGWLAWHVAGE